MNDISEMRLPDPSLKRVGGAPRHYGWALLALAAAAFGIGTTEFVIMGLLPDVARDLAVTIPQAGLLVTGYALGVTFGGPVLALATAKADRRKALLFLIGIFILGNLLCAVAPTYGLLMAARVVTAARSFSGRVAKSRRYSASGRRTPPARSGCALVGPACSSSIRALPSAGTGAAR